MLTSLYNSLVSALKEFVYRILVQTSPYLYTLCRLVCGTLYPAYASYKAIRTKNVNEYVSTLRLWWYLQYLTSYKGFLLKNMLCHKYNGLKCFNFENPCLKCWFVCLRYYLGHLRTLPEPSLWQTRIVPDIECYLPEHADDITV